MSPNYAAQRDALVSLSVAYMGARDFTLPVLRWAFGDPPPPPSECLWPPPGITKTDAQLRLRRVQAFLRQSTSVLRGVLRDIKAAQVGLGASGFEVPHSWIIAHPLDTFRGGMPGASGCSVTEIVQSAAAEDAALEKVLGEISVESVLLEGKIAGSTPPPGKTGRSERTGGDRAIAPSDSFLGAPRMTRVFISYAHSSQEHKQAVSRLVETLREEGLTVTVDTDVKTPQGPEEGWPKWMKRQIKEADWVLMLFDELYRRRFDGDEEPDRGLGATWEGVIITHHYYRRSTKNEKFIPLLADGASTDLIPDELFGYTRYFIPKQTIELAAVLRPPLSDSAREHGEEWPFTGPSETAVGQLG